MLLDSVVEVLDFGAKRAAVQAGAFARVLQKKPPLQIAVNISRGERIRTFDLTVAVFELGYTRSHPLPVTSIYSRHKSCHNEIWLLGGEQGLTTSPTALMVES